MMLEHVVYATLGIAFGFFVGMILMSLLAMASEQSRQEEERMKSALDD